MEKKVVGESDEEAAPPPSGERAAMAFWKSVVGAESTVFRGFIGIGRGNLRRRDE